MAGRSGGGGHLHRHQETLPSGAVAQNPISFAGDAGRRAVNTLAIADDHLPPARLVCRLAILTGFDWKKAVAATIPPGPAKVGKIFKIGKVPVSFSPRARGWRWSGRTPRMVGWA